MKEVKEDMELTDHVPLPDVPRLEGLRLPPEAFGNILMVFEFLHTFGETLGFGKCICFMYVFYFECDHGELFNIIVSYTKLDILRSMTHIKVFILLICLI